MALFFVIGSAGINLAMIAAGHADAYAQVGKTILSFLYLLVLFYFYFDTVV